MAQFRFEIYEKIDIEKKKFLKQENENYWIRWFPIFSIMVVTRRTQSLKFFEKFLSPISTKQQILLAHTASSLFSIFQKVTSMRKYIDQI